MADELNLEPYQIKLRDFIAKIPNEPREIPSGTPVIPRPTKAQVEALESPTANPKPQTNADFLDLTGQSHLGLMQNWAGGGIMTTCNLFVGRCCAKMGHTGFSVGQFEIAKILYNNGLGHVWVAATSGDRPRYGDIFKPKRTHLGVSLDFAGGVWRTVEAGQGGKSKGFDCVKRKEQGWDPDGLEGWVNMAALLSAGKVGIPSWLGGWWRIEENGTQEYYYHFHASGAVSYSPAPPASSFSLPVNPSMSGSCRMANYSDVLVHWNSADDDEYFQRAWQTDKKKPEHMIGIKQDKGRFKAEKLGVPAIASA
jgi:hypothetical protein